MIKPTIHRNGTSREELATQNSNARTAIREAIHALQEAAPNGRDYYPQGDEAFQIANREHCSREMMLMMILAELETLGEHIADVV